MKSIDFLEDAAALEDVLADSYETLRDHRIVLDEILQKLA